MITNTWIKLHAPVHDEEPKKKLKKKQYKRKPYNTRMKKQGIHIVDENNKSIKSLPVEKYCEINLVDRYLRFAKIVWSLEDKKITILGYGNEVLAEFTAQTLGHGDNFKEND